MRNPPWNEPRHRAGRNRKEEGRAQYRDRFRHGTSFPPCRKVGNPGSWQSDQHPGDNLWTDSMLALDPNTGKINWGYQYTPNDDWDYDGMATPILVDTTIDGKPVKAAVVSNRNGYFYAIDRSNGQFLYAIPLVENINWTTGLDPKTGKPTINEAMKPVANGKTVEKIIPGLEGGTNWFPPAYDPSTGVLFVATNQWGMGSQDGISMHANCVEGSATKTPWF